MKAKLTANPTPCRNFGDGQALWGPADKPWTDVHSKVPLATYTCGQNASNVPTYPDLGLHPVPLLGRQHQPEPIEALWLVIAGQVEHPARYQIRHDNSGAGTAGPLPSHRPQVDPSALGRGDAFAEPSPWLCLEVQVPSLGACTPSDCAPATGASSRAAGRH